MKLCLIGSTKFMDEYRKVNRELTLAGHIVYSVATISSSQAGENVKAEAQGITDEEKETLDLVHLIKIINSDACVLITDATGYVGYSTKREIKWASMIGKQVILPNNVRGFGEILKGFYEEWLPKALDERSGIDLHSKIKI
jgi:hypothetical protein